MNNIGVSNYLVTLLAIFYLQKQKILPSVALLQKNLEPVSIQGLFNFLFNLDDL